MASHLVTQATLGWMFASVACAFSLLCIMEPIVFCRTCLNGGRQLDRDTKTNWTVHRRDVKAQKPHEPFGRCCYLRINSATVIRSVNASFYSLSFRHCQQNEPFSCTPIILQPWHALYPTATRSLAHLNPKVKVEKVSERVLQLE